MLYTLHREHGECAHILHFLLGRYCTIKKRSSSQVYIFARCTTNKMHQYGRSKTTHTRQTESCARRRLRLVNFPLYMYIPDAFSSSHAANRLLYACIHNTNLVYFFILVSLVLPLSLSLALSAARDNKKEMRTTPPVYPTLISQRCCKPI